MSSTQAYVVDPDGTRAALAPEARPWDISADAVQVRMEDGTLVSLPADLLVMQDDGGYRIAHRFAELTARAGTSVEQVIPVVAEHLQVGRRVVETGGVRVTKRVEEVEEVADVPLVRETVDVKRVPVNRAVESAPAPRQEGDTLILPLVEEVLVVEKRLVLREELHVRRTRTEVREPQRVTLRREVAEVERFEQPPDGTPAPADVPS